MTPETAMIKPLEMSRYIDLELYHAVERTHPFYMEMVAEIHFLLREFSESPAFQVLEIGAGTGLLTEELVKYPNFCVDALDYDANCCEVLQKHIRGRANSICGDAVLYKRQMPYDLAVSVFAHDHIHYDRRFDFAANIRKNLKTGGRYVMGGEILPHFSDPVSHCEALYTYHGYIVNKALREKHFALAQIEINALASGVELVGDFKRHEKMFEDEMLSAPFRLISKKKIGPDVPADVGGVFVYVFEAI